jgi:hypothetical protein
MTRGKEPDAGRAAIPAIVTRVRFDRRGLTTRRGNRDHFSPEGAWAFALSALFASLCPTTCRGAKLALSRHVTGDTTDDGPLNAALRVRGGRESESNRGCASRRQNPSHVRSRMLRIGKPTNQDALCSDLVAPSCANTSPSPSSTKRSMNRAWPTRSRAEPVDGGN